MNNPVRLLFGLFLIIVGIIFLLDLGDYVDAGEAIGTWWPVVVIAFGVVALFGSARSMFAAAVMMSAGVILLLANLDVIPVSAGQLVLPLILIAVGTGLLVVRSGVGRTGDPADTVSAFAAFGGHEVKSRSGAFKGGSLTALFGGVSLDLRDAQLDPSGAGIDTFVAFGGIDIAVPRGWRVNARGMPMFGGFEDNTQAAPDMSFDGPSLTVSGVVLFGEVNIKHTTSG